jgi:hypothetical protein
VAVGQKDPVILHGAIGVNELRARHAFLEQFSMLFPMLRQLLAHTSWRGLAVSLLATLDADPLLTPYVTCFLTHDPANQP